MAPQKCPVCNVHLWHFFIIKKSRTQIFYLSFSIASYLGHVSNVLIALKKNVFCLGYIIESVTVPSVTHNVPSVTKSKNCYKISSPCCKRTNYTILEISEHVETRDVEVENKSNVVEAVISRYRVKNTQENPD